MKLQTLYVKALEALEELSTLKPGRCDLPAVERAKRKGELCETVTRFIRAGVKTGSEWEKRQDTVLWEMSNHI